LVDATDQSITFKFYNRGGTLVDTYSMNKSGGGSTTIAFQNGAQPTSAYAGNIDTHLSQANATTNYATAASLLVDGDDPNGSGQDKRALLRWDVSAIPAGKTVTSASLTFNVTDASTQAYQVYQLKRTWAETGPTWGVYGSGTSWQTAGAEGANDRGTTSLAAVTGSATGSLTVPLNASGLAIVQGWVNGTTANQGLILLNAANTNGLDFSSSEAGTVSTRPRLSVTYQ
jgi:hypothetical protein